MELARETIRALTGLEIEIAQGGLQNSLSFNGCLPCTGKPCAPSPTEFSCDTCDANSNCGCTHD